MLKIISIREFPDKAQEGVAFFQKQWANEKNKIVFEDCILNCLNSPSMLPQWYLMYSDDKIIGCAGLIPNDFISRMDLCPWICSLYIVHEFRGKAYASLLLSHIKEDAKSIGFNELFLCTSHIGFYEKYGWNYIADGYHISGKSMRIYNTKT